MINYTEGQIKVNRLIWEDAIASGDYKKGKSKLKRVNEYCCLGIAAELFAKENNVTITTNSFLTFFNGETTFAPYYVINALGLLNETGNSKYVTDKSLTHINDDNDSFIPVLKAIETGNYYK